MGQAVGVRPCPLPAEALLAAYAGGGGYADCYTTELPRAVSHAEYVEAFFTGGVFRIERWLIRLFLARSSTAAQAGQLARGEVDTFAAWRVEGRATDQLLLCDVGGRTRSWLMVERVAGGGATRLYFGSAVVPARSGPDGRARMGWVFSALLGFHRLYSRVLLRSASTRLTQAGQ